jgi:hypothetical protein
MGLYKSTELDTTERKIPWYYPLAFVVLAAIIAGTVYAARHVTQSFRCHTGAIPVTSEENKASVAKEGRSAQRRLTPRKRATRRRSHERKRLRGVAQAPHPVAAVDGDRV